MNELTFTTTNTADGLTLFGRSYMPDAPKAVISLAHGLGEHSGRYAEMAAWLAEKKIGMNLVDLRGHGKSLGKRGVCDNIDLMHGDMEALLDYTRERQPDVPHFLMGHSMGGLLVLAYGLQHQPDGLAGVISQAPALKPFTQPPGIQLAILRMIRPIMPGFTANNGLDPTLVTKDQPAVSAYVADPLVHNRISVALALDLLRTGEWVLDKAADWHLPLLLMHGGDDRITSRDASAEFARATGDRCRFETIPDGFHEIHNDPEREGVYRRIDGWIADQLS